MKYLFLTLISLISFADNWTVIVPIHQTDSIINLLKAKGHKQWGNALNQQFKLYMEENPNCLTCVWSREAYEIACKEVRIQPTEEQFHRYR